MGRERSQTGKMGGGKGLKGQAGGQGPGWNLDPLIPVWKDSGEVMSSPMLAPAH